MARLSLVLTALVATFSSLGDARAEEPRPGPGRADLGGPALHPAAPGAPVIQGASYRETRYSSRSARPQHREHLWLSLDPATVAGEEVVLQPVWGRGTRAMSHLWGRTHPVREGEIFAHTSCGGAHRDQPFTLGLRVRVVHSDGSLSPPSAPVFIHHQGEALSSEGWGTDRVFLIVVAAAFLGLGAVFRREESSETRIRLAAATALASVLFLSLTPALPWQRVEDVSYALPAVDCFLGSEQQCATYAPDGGPDPLAAASASAPRRAELAQWIASSTSLRSGLVLTLILLLPALIWLLAVPRLRAAQASVFIGATAAGYTMLSTLLYLALVPRWMTTSRYLTADVSLLCCSAIIVAAGLILRESFALCRGESLPKARVLNLKR